MPPRLAALSPTEIVITGELGTGLIGLFAVTSEEFLNVFFSNIIVSHTKMLFSCINMAI